MTILIAFQEFQDTSEYVRHELKSLEEQQQALDKVGEKLEIELRRAMGCKGKDDSSSEGSVSPYAKNQN